MKPQTVQKVLNNGEFQQMARQKARLGWIFSALTFVIYVGYIVLIGFSPATVGTPVAPRAATTWGIYIGVFVILISVVLTGIYVVRANGKYEDMTQKVIRDVMQEEQA